MNKNDVKKLVKKIKGEINNNIDFFNSSNSDFMLQLEKVLNNSFGYNLTLVEGRNFLIKGAYETPIGKKQLIENNAIEEYSPKCKNIFNDIWINVFDNEIVVDIRCYVSYKCPIYDEFLDVELLREKI